MNWIKTNERLPVKNKEIILSDKYGNVNFGYFLGYNGFHYEWLIIRLDYNKTYFDNEILAWMPKPAPFKLK